MTGKRGEFDMLKSLKAKSAAVSALAAVAIASPLVLAGTAQAAGGTAPSCVSRSVDTSVKAVYLGNVCGKTMRVTVVFTNGSESPCFAMASGATLRVNYAPYTYARTAVC
ncbi:hypothetical protein F4556_007205 [Kitasatospora gansuensis]|uniref:Beta-Ig-H3/fasciclin n=1 Tax=Kitasatospora gansuensis TaxID=258050 RepID=A0A7W7SJL6_9ACTN|nr:hypothetical protein [Kitasatospora gansuensis]MBB4951670.1 hypothetical protein [Kitasatospora gansuensis]